MNFLEKHLKMHLLTHSHPIKKKKKEEATRVKIYAVMFL